MRNRTLVAAGIALMAVGGCSTGIAGQPIPDAGTGQGGGGAQIASVADLGAVVQHNAVAKNSVHVEASVNVPAEGALTATGDMKFGNSTASAQMDMNLPGLGEFTVVIVGTSVYMKLPASMLSELGQNGTKPWVEVPLDSSASASIGSTANLASGMDPTHMIEEIKSAGTITQVSREQLSGVPTTHYAINVNVAKLAQSMTDNPLEEQNLSRVNVPTVPFDLWVNSQNLPMRIVSTMFLSATSGAQPEQVTTTTNYSNWGEQISISAPPADQVTSMGG